MIDILEKVNDLTLIANIKDYMSLSMAKSMTESEEEYYDSLLKKAEDNGTFDFLVNEIDHVLGHRQDLINIMEISDIQALLRERIGTKDIPKYIDHRRPKGSQKTTQESVAACH